VRGRTVPRIAYIVCIDATGDDVPTPNYGYEKRQKELAKKLKKQDKLRERAERKTGQGESDAPDDASGPTPPDGPAPAPAHTGGQPSDNS